MRGPARTTPPAVGVARFLLGAGVALVLLHAAFHLTWRFRNVVPGELKDLFDVKSERGLLTWVTVVTNALLGVACLRRGAAEHSRAWLACGALFLYLSCDDATLLHERVGWLAEPVLGERALFLWILILGPLFALLGVLAFVHMWRELSADPPARRRLILAFGMLGTALLLELVEKPLTVSGLTLNDFPLWAYTSPMEELLELLGPALLLVCVGGAVEREGPTTTEGEGAGAARPAEPRREVRRAG